ncbi:MAG: hypothetical protein ACXQTL_06515 [Methanosarcinales archaeon]
MKTEEEHVDEYLKKLKGHVRIFADGMIVGQKLLHDELQFQLDEKIKECESAIRDDAGNAEYWFVRKKTLEEVRGWLE